MIESTTQLATLVSQLLSTLATEQNRLAAIYAQRQQVLSTNQLAELEELSGLEADTVQKLAQIKIERAELLKMAQQQGLAVSSLTGLVAIWQDEELTERVRALAEQAQQLQQEKQIQQLLLSRAKRHYTDLADLVVRRGKKQVTYNQLESEAHSTGVIFDASA